MPDALRAYLMVDATAPPDNRDDQVCAVGQMGKCCSQEYCGLVAREHWVLGLVVPVHSEIEVHVIEGAHLLVEVFMEQRQAAIRPFRGCGGLLASGHPP